MNVSTKSEVPGTGRDVAGDLDVTQDLNKTLILNEDDDEGNSDATQTVNVSDKNSGYESTDTVELAISTEPIIPMRRRLPRLGGKPPGPSTAATAAVDPAPPNIDDEPQDNLDEEGSSNIPTVASGEASPIPAPSTAASTPRPSTSSTGAGQERRNTKPRPSSKERAFQKAAETIITYEKRSYRGDGVDEECERLQIKYRRWQGNDLPKEEPHASHLPFGTTPIIAVDQHQHDYCLLCPRQRALDENWDVQRHYRSVHELGHLVVNDTIIMVCKCSDVRSRGWKTDKSTRNRHFHCIICHHPRDNQHQIGNHMHKKHREISRSDVSHLLKDKVKAFSEPE